MGRMDRREPRKVGVEEELLLVDPGTGERLDVSRRVLHEHRALPEGSKEDAASDLDHELLQHMVETRTDATADLGEIAAQLRGARRTAIRAAEAAGAAVAAVGTAPLSQTNHRVTVDPRYQRIVQRFGETARNAGTLGTHVHVDVASDEEAIRVIDGLRPWLPLLVALSANSPYSSGVDTGYASWRQQVWTRLPSAGQAEPFGTVEEYRRVAEALVATGAALDEGMLYFDARPAADLPTVEIRVADACTEVQQTLLVAALSRALVETVAGLEPPAPAIRTDLLRAAHWRAARFGTDGELVHPVTGDLVPAADAVAVLVDTVGPALDVAGDRRLVEDALSRIAATGTGARRQRSVQERTGEIRAVVADLVERTAAEASGSGSGE